MTNKDPLIDSETGDKEKDDGDTSLMIATLTQDAIEGWSDVRRQEFCKMFDARSRAARYILIKTAEKLLEVGQSRHIVGCNVSTDAAGHQGVRALYDRPNSYESIIGGRSTATLDKLAEERAENILRELPAVRKALSILQPDVAKMMDQLDAYKVKGEALLVALAEISESISLADVPQSMTIGEFRKFAHDREDKRRAIARKLNDIGGAAQSLDDTINKKMFKGIPGLSEAVVKVINTHIERAANFDIMGRRVSEKVMFGDSVAATDLLKHFEQDEVKISDSVKNELKAAVEKLLGPGAKKPLKKKTAKK